MPRSALNITSQQPDKIWDIAHVLQGTKRAGLGAKLIWVLVLIGIGGNEIKSRYAKSAMRNKLISMAVTYSKAKIKSIVISEMKRKWQKHWHRERE